MSKETAIHISKDERERAVFRSRRMYETDMISNLATAEDRSIAKGLAQGIEQGIVKGRVEGRMEGRIEGQVESIRKIMDNMGLPLEQALRVLEVPQEKIPAYREMLNQFNFFKS